MSKKALSKATKHNPLLSFDFNILHHIILLKFVIRKALLENVVQLI